MRDDSIRHAVCFHAVIRVDHHDGFSVFDSDAAVNVAVNRHFGGHGAALHGEVLVLRAFFQRQGDVQLDDAELNAAIERGQLAQ